MPDGMGAVITAYDTYDPIQYKECTDSGEMATRKPAGKNSHRRQTSTPTRLRICGGCLYNRLRNVRGKRGETSQP